MRKLLIIDDDPVDAGFVMQAFSCVADQLHVVHVADLEQMHLMLLRQPFDYVLLDINLPGVDGMEILKSIRTNAKTAVLPVIMLSSSANAADIDRSYALGANAYAVKPTSVKGYRNFAEGFTRFWVDQCLTPDAYTQHTSSF